MIADSNAEQLATIMPGLVTDAVSGVLKAQEEAKAAEAAKKVDEKKTDAQRKAEADAIENANLKATVAELQADKTNGIKDKAINAYIKKHVKDVSFANENARSAAIREMESLVDYNAESGEVASGEDLSKFFEGRDYLLAGDKGSTTPTIPDNDGTGGTDGAEAEKQYEKMLKEQGADDFKVTPEWDEKFRNVSDTVLKHRLK